MHIKTAMKHQYPVISIEDNEKKKKIVTTPNVAKMCRNHITCTRNVLVSDRDTLEKFDSFLKS